VVLTGPSGIGKTVVMDAVGASATARGERVLRVTGAETERWISYAGLADLLGQVPVDFLAELPDPQRTAVNAVLLRGRASGNGSRASLARRLAWQAMLDRCAESGPVLLLVDDAQWLDAASADVIGYAARRAGRVRMVVAERRPERAEGPCRPDASEPADGRERADRSAGGHSSPTGRYGAWRAPASHAGPPTRAASLAASPVLVLAVPPLAAHDVAEMLDLYGLPARAASKLHADSGGNPYLALALSGAFADRTAVAWRPGPLPHRVYDLIRDILDAITADVRETLLIAALAARPTVELLLRAGRLDAERDIRQAAAAGLLVTDGSAIRFTPPAVATVLADSTSAVDRSAIHTALATVVTDAAERARHRALSSANPDAGVARSLVTAADEARRRGARGLAAELYLLAADRTPSELHAQRLEWLVAAAEAAAAASRPEIVDKAADAVIASDASAAHRVRVRMALIDLSGQALADMDETFAAALADAGDEPALTAPLRLRLAWQAMVDGNPTLAEAEADKAIGVARDVADATTEAMALAVKAQVARVQGRRDYLDALDLALALPQPELDGWLHLTPRYLAARFAVFDDRLDEARAELLRMLAIVERGGGEELVEVLRSLSEVSVRAGRCREALDFADRAIRVAEEAGLSPGPAWYNAAVAELAGGTIGRAAAYAERGIRASEQERDAIYLKRNLHALGQARLRSGDARAGVALLRRIRDLEAAQGVAEPSVLRWHSDLAAGLVAIGELAEADETIVAAREAVANRPHNGGVTARLDRSDALVRSELGDAESAASLLVAAVGRFDVLGQPVERGHTLLVLGQVERRRRRYAAGRAAVGEALAAFASTGARPWVEQATRTLATVDGASADARPAPRDRTARASALAALTATEARIATMVRGGATNREIATRLFLSVKTVEATLTRVYRKLGVRSRTQLSSRLGPG